MPQDNSEGNPKKHESNPSSTLPMTGERYIPGMGARIAAEHLNRYGFAGRYVSGKKVLDVACGEGYGSAFLAKYASGVVGIDVDESATLHAQRKYGEIAGLEFKTADIGSLPFADGEFDVIICFETIEHVEDPGTALAELARVLAPRGVLLISTPNTVNYSERFGYQNKFHVKELELSEFKEVLGGHFRNVSLLGQFSGAASHILSVDEDGVYEPSEGSSVIEFADVPKLRLSDKAPTSSPLYFIAVCSRYLTATTPKPIAFFDPTDWVAVEDEFLLRKLTENPSVNAALLEELLSTLSDLRVTRLGCEEAENRLALTEQRRDKELENELAILRRAYRALEAKVLADAVAPTAAQLKSGVDSTQSGADSGTSWEEMSQKVADAETRLAAIEASTIWRSTAGMRRLITMLRGK